LDNAVPNFSTVGLFFLGFIKYASPKHLYKSTLIKGVISQIFTMDALSSVVPTISSHDRFCHDVSVSVFTEHEIWEPKSSM
jgi:hypothetical protein